MADEYIAENTSFKHDDTTKVMKIRFLMGNRIPIHPDQSHKYIAKVAYADGAYKGDYPVTLVGNQFQVKSGDLRGISNGNYRLEIWESYTDDNGVEQTSIFPTPNTFVSFSVTKNIQDTAWDLTVDVSFQDLVNQATISAGQNLEIEPTITLGPDESADVTQKYENGKNKLTFSIPKGKQGGIGPAPKFEPGILTKLPYDAQPTLILNKIDGGYRIDLGIPVGEPGKDGYSPKRGTDFWTTDDINDIKSWAQESIKEELDSQIELSKSIFNPQAFENEAALKNKFPTGASGLMVTVDNGHKWLWVNNSWKDCGIYQSSGIADRSIDNSKIKQKVSALRTTQFEPWIVDFDHRKLKVSQYSCIYDDVPWSLPTGDMDLSSYEMIHIGYDTTTGKLNGYQSYPDVPSDSYYIGFVDFNTRQAFLQFNWIDASSISNGKMKYASKIKRENLPAPATGLVCFSPWTVNTYGDAPTVTVNGYAFYFAKGTSMNISSGKHVLDINKKGAYYLYLDFDYENATAQIKATDSPYNLPINSPWIGFIETNSHIYQIFNNSNNFSYNFSMITPGKITVDFEKGSLYVPVIWNVVNPLKVAAPNNSGAEIKFDNSKRALFVGIDPSQTDINKMFVFDSDLSKIQSDYQYFGWISIYTREYDFGKYGSTHDLAAQPWLNKKVACLGDSITEGDSGEGGLIDSYVPKLSKYIGTVPENYGKCGALITKKTDDDISFVNRVGAIKDKDVVTVFGGINDFQWNAPLGTMADGPEKPTTFYGALKYVITTLSVNNPKAKLMLITPMKTTKFQYHTFDDSGNLMRNANGNTQLEFVNAIKQVADYYSIPVLDMYNCSNYSPYLPSQRGHDSFTADGLHPTAHGYERIAQTIGHAINGL